MKSYVYGSGRRVWRGGEWIRIGFGLYQWPACPQNGKSGPLLGREVSHNLHNSSYPLW